MSSPFIGASADTPKRKRAAAGLRCGRARAIHSEERPALLDWLDDGLREGRRGRLQREFPLSLDPNALHAHRAVFADGLPVAHAMIHVVRAHSSAPVAVGLIGLVYTKPEMRRRGLARECIEACLAELERREVPLALLWSDRHAYYESLGFHGAGFEMQYRIDARICRRAAEQSRPKGASERIRVEAVRAPDWGALEALYAAKPVRAARQSGALERLAAAPDTRVVLARRGMQSIAYAALGRGDDFPDVVHEWAGEPSGVIACLEHFCRDTAEIGWLCGPVDEDPAGALRAAGAACHAGRFALAKLLDAPALWRALSKAPRDRQLFELDETATGKVLRCASGEHEIADAEILGLLFGPEMPVTLEPRFSQQERAALRRQLPYPLYLWGFDSI